MILSFRNTFFLNEGTIFLSKYENIPPKVKFANSKDGNLKFHTQIMITSLREIHKGNLRVGSKFKIRESERTKIFIYI